jgi:uncharacterized membrane protein
MSKINYFCCFIVFLFFIGIIIYNFKYIENYKNNENKEKKDDKYWGINYYGSVQNDNYWVPQLNLHPSYIFYDSDYNET